MKFNSERSDVSISIIMPVYNSSEYLEKCINSILDQSYEDFELILIDDGSTDESYKICTMYAEKDKRIKIFRQKNKGPSAARNHGLKYVKGKYIRFVDADDYLPKDSLKMLIAPFENAFSIDMVIGSFTSNSEFYKEKLIGEYPIEELIDRLVPAMASFYYGVVWNKLYRTELIKKHGIEFNEEIYWSEDCFFNLMYFSHCRKVYYISQSVYDYYWHEGSLCNRVEEYPHEDRYRIEILRYQEIRKLIQKKKPDIKLDKIAIDYLIHNVYWYLRLFLEQHYSKTSKVKLVRETLKNPIIMEAVDSGIYDPSAIEIKCFVFLIRRKCYKFIDVFYSIQSWIGIFLRRSVIVKYCIKKLRGRVSTFPF